MSAQPPPAPQGDPVRTAPCCYRHPDRETYISCTRCRRPICPECMTPASVGFQCPECVREGARSVRPAAAAFGGRATQRTPVTYGLIGVNALVFLLTAIGGGGSLLLSGTTSTLFDRFSLIATTRYLDAGNGAVVQLTGVSDGAYYRLLTSCFLHFGLLHLAANMYSLLLLGTALERILGWQRFLAVYLLAGLGGSVATLLFANPATESAGASGAIFGLFAAYFLIARKVGADTSAILVTVGINLFITFAIPVISKTGHLGGLAVGALAAAVVVYAPAGRRRTPVQVAGLLGLLGVLALVAVLRGSSLG